MLLGWLLRRCQAVILMNCKAAASSCAACRACRVCCLCVKAGRLGAEDRCAPASSTMPEAAMLSIKLRAMQHPHRCPCIEHTQPFNQPFSSGACVSGCIQEHKPCRWDVNIDREATETHRASPATVAAAAVQSSCTAHRTHAGRAAAYRNLPASQIRMQRCSKPQYRAICSIAPQCTARQRQCSGKRRHCTAVWQLPVARQRTKLRVSRTSLQP